MNDYSRRSIIAAGAVGAAVAATAASAQSFGNPDRPPRGAHQHHQSDRRRGAGSADPRNGQAVSVSAESARDGRRRHAVVWATFNVVHKRIQDGGWARQVTQADFATLRHHFRRQHAARAGRHPRAALASAGRMGGDDRRPVPRHRARRRRPPLGARRQGRAISGTSRPACRTRCRASAPAAANSSSPSTTAIRRRTTPCC